MTKKITGFIDSLNPDNVNLGFATSFAVLGVVAISGLAYGVFGYDDVTNNELEQQNTLTISFNNWDQCNTIPDTSAIAAALEAKTPGHAEIVVGVDGGCKYEFVSEPE